MMQPVPNPLPFVGTGFVYPSGKERDLNKIEPALSQVMGRRLKCFSPSLPSALGAQCRALPALWTALQQADSRRHFRGAPLVKAHSQLQPCPIILLLSPVK